MPNRRIHQYSSRRSSAMGRNHNSVGYASSVKLGPVTHTVLVALMITVLGLIYLTQATQATGYDYTLEEIDSKIADLAVQKQDLEVENAKLTSLQTVRDSAVAANMTPSSELEYTQQ